RIGAQVARAVEQRADVVARRERAILVVAQVEARGRHARDARREVGAEALALEVVAIVLPPEEERERVLGVLDLLELAVVGAPHPGGAGRGPPGRRERLLDLKAIERALAPGRVLEAGAETRVERDRRLGLVEHAEADRIDAVVVEQRLEPRDAALPAAAPL